MSEDTEKTDWRLCRAQRTTWRGNYSSSLLDEWDSLEEVEQRLGIVPGLPFLLRPDGTVDSDVVAYFTSSSFKRLAPASRLSYAMDLKVFFSFLERQGTSWRDATHDSLLDYEYWRRRDADNLQRVSGAKFARELAACGRFYKWQVDHGVIEASPVLATTYRDRRGDVATRAQLQPMNVRSVKVKWLTPRAYRRWRDVGLGGYNGDGLLDSSWRGRNDDRNVSMSELMWSSGLRLREAGSVLLTELPTAQPADQYVRGHVAEAVAKGRGRDFWVSRSALRRIDAYVMTTRAAAVRRAQDSGRYDEIAERRLVTQMNARGDLIMEDRRGRSERTNINEMDSEIRRCLFQQTDDGVEPLSLWLTEAGTPMPYLSWEAVFAGASSRCATQGVPITCHPHMLRHSFALRMLVTLIHNFDRRLGLSERERLEYRHLFGDPWVLVQQLLGHSSLVTTKSYYLEPVQGLQVDMFLNADTDDESVQQLLTRISEMSPLVQDLEGPA